MAIQELDELLALLGTPEDKALFEQILERNGSARDRVTTSEDLTRSLLDNDTAATARIEARKQAVQRQDPAKNPSAAAATQPQGLSQQDVDNLVSAKVRELFPTLLKGEFEKEDFNTRVRGLVKTTADEMVPGLISTTTRKADEIFTIRSANLKEFGKELDAAAFTTFIEESAKKGNTYGTYVDAYNEYVKEERVQARIAKGIADGVAAHPKVQPQVPGTTLATGNTMAAAFMKSNPMNKTGTERGAAIDQGAQALRRLVAARTE